MWFPYSLPVRWKPESERDRTNESLADSTEREFLIGFYLHNPQTRDWQIEVWLKEPQWVQATEHGQAFSIGYYPNQTGQVSEIICRIRISTPAGAVRCCHAHVSRILGYWSATKGRGFAVAGFRIADLNHDARWCVLPHRPSSESFDLPPPCDALPESYWTINTLYREARNSTSDTYRFLCCHKILSMWGKGVDPFGLVKARASKSGEEITGWYHVSREMLALSGLIHFRPDLEGVDFVDLLEPLATWRQWALQAVIDERLPDRLGEYEHSRELSCIANLVDLAVHRVLADEITGWQDTAADI
jgi:hypothetical protein